MFDFGLVLVKFGLKLVEFDHQHFLTVQINIFPPTIVISPYKHLELMVFNKKLVLNGRIQPNLRLNLIKLDQRSRIRPKLSFEFMIWNLKNRNSNKFVQAQLNCVKSVYLVRESSLSWLSNRWQFLIPREPHPWDRSWPENSCRIFGAESRPLSSQGQLSAREKNNCVKTNTEKVLSRHLILYIRHDWLNWSKIAQMWLLV